MPRKLSFKAFAPDSPLRTIEQSGGVTVSAIEDASITYQKCDWYSPDATDDTGALKLPRGNTDERPTTVLGGREKITIDLTVSNPDLAYPDPAFDMMDPWIWSWSGNYNRNAMTSETVQADNSPTGLTLLRGSTYTFRNFAVGHRLFLKSQALSQAEFDAGNTDLYKLGEADGVTNNGARRDEGSSDPGVVTWTIPEDYSGNSVIIQHGQWGMNNVVPITNPPAETLGYIRLNTDLGTDETTGVGLEVYTGQGWIEVGGAGGDGLIQTHPTGTLELIDWNTAAGSEDWNTASGTDDWGGAIVSAFLDDGNLSVNDDYAVVAHDGSTGAGIPMLRADMSNLSVDLVNTKYSFFRANAQTLTECDVSGSATSRLAFANSVEAGIPNIVLEDSNKLFRINKDVTNSFFKFELKLKPSSDCTFQVWKNGSKLSYADYVIDANYHATISWIEAASFDDTFEFRLSGSSSISVTNTDTLLIEFIGS